MAEIRIDPDRTLGTVDRRIFSGFAEHLGRCIYGGLFEPGSALADEHGFRTDVLEAIRRLRPPVLRWPGGNFVSGYHWTDGIGPVAERPRRLDLAWHAEEPNTFGTDEFMDYCETLGTEPYLCLNLGTGTLDEACAWVEYCNGAGNTYWAEQRRRNGHEEPYGVRYWGLGNEMWGAWQIGSLEAQDYVKRARSWAAALRRVDPTIELVSCGQDGISEWDRIVIDGLAPAVDYHSIHLYTGTDDHLGNLLSPLHAERALRICGGLIERCRQLQPDARDVRIVYDEWNVWFRERGETSGLEERYTLSDALAVATYLNVFVRSCRVLAMANLAQIVNVIAPIVTSPDALFLQTIYHPLRLAAELTREIALDPVIVCESLPAGAGGRARPRPVDDLGPLGVLDVAASRDRDGARLTVSIVNRALTTVSLDVRCGRVVREAVAHRVMGSGPEDRNSFTDPDRVGVRSAPISPSADGSVTLQLEPCAVTYLELTT